MLSSTILRVPQGVGDIFWCYQKVAPYVDCINFEIAYTGKLTEVSRRAEQFLHTWPQTGTVKMVPVGSKEYKDIWQSTPDSPYPRKERGVYAVNAALEAGTRLEDIHDGAKVEWGVPLIMEPVDLPDKYVCLYVSGNTKNRTIVRQWGIDEWYEFVMTFYDRCPHHELVIIGADFDKPMVDELEYVLEAFDPHIFVGLEPAKVMTILDKADFFIGYQSGLGILADNLGTPQLMMYFQHLEKMKYTWCQPGHKNKVFWADTFDRSTRDVLGKLTWEPK